MAAEVQYDVDARGIARLTLNRPDKRNAFDEAQVAAFNDAMARAADDGNVRVIVIAGNGPAFSAGADFSYLQRIGGLSPAENLADAREFAAMAESIRAASVPVVSRVHGGAFGGGVAIAAACDIVIAAEPAQFGITEARHGFTPSLMVPFLIGRIGQRGCRRWCLTGETLSAAEAFRIGLVDRLAAADALDAALDETVDYLLKASPGGLLASKESIAENARPRLDAAAADRALAAFVDGRASSQAAEGSAAFLEKRPPEWAREVDG